MNKINIISVEPYNEYQNILDTLENCSDIIVVASQGSHFCNIVHPCLLSGSW